MSPEWIALVTGCLIIVATLVGLRRRPHTDSSSAEDNRKDVLRANLGKKRARRTALGAVAALLFTVVLSGMLFAAPIAAFLMTGIWPVCKKLAAPIVCPSGYLGSIVVLDETSLRQSSDTTVTNVTSELYCFNAMGFPTIANSAHVFLGVWLVLAVILIVSVLGPFGLAVIWNALKSRVAP